MENNISGAQALSPRTALIAEAGHQTPHFLFGGHTVGTLDDGLFLRL